MLYYVKLVIKTYNFRIKEKEQELKLKRMKEIEKDEELNKELQSKLKKYLLEKIKIYTNVIYVKGKKFKIEELMREVDKVTHYELMKILEQEEISVCIFI